MCAVASSCRYRAGFLRRMDTILRIPYPMDSHRDDRNVLQEESIRNIEHCQKFRGSIILLVTQLAQLSNVFYCRLLKFFLFLTKKS